MLGGKAPKVDDDLVVAWMTQDWEENLLPGPTNEHGAQRARQRICAPCSISAARTSPTFELNGDAGDRGAGARWRA